MRKVLCIYVILLLFLAKVSSANEAVAVPTAASTVQTYSKYHTQPGITISNILRRLHLYPLWGEKGYVKKVLALNSSNMHTGDLFKLKSGVDIYLPVVNNHPAYKYNKNGYIILPEPDEEIRYPATEKNSIPLEKLSLIYPCNTYLDSQVYNKVESLIDSKSGKIREVVVDFRCDDTSNVKPYSVLPWMHTYNENRKIAGDSEEEKQQQTYYFFPYIGKGDVTYKEGPTFSTEFEHYYLGLQYRQIIPDSTWHIDTSASYTIKNKSTDYASSDPKILDIDFRVGKSFHLFNEPWHFTLFAGAYYTQMFVKDNLYGYKGTYYTQFYPELRRVFKSGNALTFYVKYVPTAKDFLSSKTGERSIEYGSSYFYRTDSMPLMFKLHFLDFQFNSEKTNTDVKIKQFNFSIGTGF